MLHASPCSCSLMNTGWVKIRVESTIVSDFKDFLEGYLGFPGRCAIYFRKLKMMIELMHFDNTISKCHFKFIIYKKHTQFEK